MYFRRQGLLRHARRADGAGGAALAGGAASRPRRRVDDPLGSMVEPGDDDRPLRAAPLVGRPLVDQSLKAR